ncbi:MAG: Crp/Fnr family transcriptional regulator [Bacteroidia bacterium]
MNFDIAKYCFVTGSVFEGLPEESCQELKTGMIKLDKKKGEIIFNKGAFPSGVYILRKGKVMIYQANQNGKSQILNIFKKGEFFGYKPLLCDDVNPVTAEVLEDASLSFIPKAVFLKVLEETPQLSKHLLRTLACEFSVWVNTATAFAQQSARERFALVLLILNEKFRDKDKDEPVELNMSREDLASYTGTAIETLVRIIRELKDAKIIQVKGRKIKIINTDILRKMTESY